MKNFLSILLAALSTAAATPIAEPLSIVGSRALDSCPSGGTLPPGYLSPTLMVPISKKLPDIAFGGTKVPIITPNDFCTIFNLVVPPSAAGKTCTLEFLFPDYTETLAPYVYYGAGHFIFTGYAFGSGATEQTTYNNPPPSGPSPPSPPAVLSPGNAYIINVGGCAVTADMTEGLEVSGALCSTDTTFSFLESDDLACPIGFYVSIT
jgi:hypothetical protein